MKIDTYPQYTKLPDNHISGLTVIVIDVLRSSSSIIHAVENGADKIIPAADAGDVANIAGRLGLRDCVLAGERGGVCIPGFALGNSPMEYTNEAVGGKTVIISTSNGTGAIYGMRGAKNVLIGGIINSTAVAKRALELGNDIILMCAGTDGAISADDLCAAGAIADAISRYAQTSIEASDMTLVSCMVYADWREGRANLAVTKHYSKLLSLGFEADIKFCFSQDITSVVPEYENGIIR